MATITYTTPGACSCCGTTPTACACYFPIPIGATNVNPPYSSYANAAAAITARVFDCRIYGNDDSYTVTSTLGANSIAISGSQAIGAGNNGLTLWMAVSLKAGSTIQFDWVATAAGSATESDSEILIQILKCDWSQLGTSLTDSDPSPSGFSGTLTGPQNKFGPITIPSDDTYFLFLSFTSGYGSTTTSVAVDWTVTADDTAAFQPVVALWDDSGTTRQLEACPKLYLPPLTESTGDWYVDCASASSAISTLISNCVGYIESKTNVTTFTATNGGATLTLAEALTAGATSCPTVWGSVNAVNAATLTFTLTTGAGTAKVTVIIYDYTGTVVQSSGLQSSPWASSGLPYHGRYFFSVAMSSTLSTASYSLVVSSSSTMTVNSVQAVYDVGLTCPARLNCGDSCP